MYWCNVTKNPVLVSENYCTTNSCMFSRKKPSFIDSFRCFLLQVISNILTVHLHQNSCAASLPSEALYSLLYIQDSRMILLSLSGTLPHLYYGARRSRRNHWSSPYITCMVHTRCLSLHCYGFISYTDIVIKFRNVILLTLPSLK